MNELGTFLWERAGEPLDRLVEAVTEEWDVAEEQAREDALEFFERLIDSGALVSREE
ncbi:MAG: PqqD family protein [Acidobacteriota bacterium]